MKSKITFITSLFVLLMMFGANLMAQSEEEGAEVTGPTLTIISGFEGGSNYQMAMDIQRMCRKTLGTPQYDIQTESIPKIGPNGDTLRAEPLYEGEIGEIMMEEKVTKVATGDTIDFIKVLDSEGSYYNFLKVNKTGADIAFLQYDVLLYQSLKDLKRTYKKTENIRILLPMGTEQIHIITLKKDGKGIEDFSDLKKKRVGIGSALMGTNITAKYIKEVTGSKWEDVEIPFDKSFKALFNGSIDAFFYVGAKPVKDLANISKAMRDKITLISIPADKDGKLELAYEKVTITPEDYKWLAANVETFAVKSVLVTSLAGQTPETEQAIQQMLEIIKANKDNSANHPNWKAVKFAKDDDIDWEYYPAALKTY